MSQIESTTKKGTEGFNISYSDEQALGKALLKELPDGWKVKFNWCQILFSDVQYEIDEENKVVEIVYNQNLSGWAKALIKEIKSKIK
jgi:hypothetical protein